MNTPAYRPARRHRGLATARSRSRFGDWHLSVALALVIGSVVSSGASADAQQTSRVGRLHLQMRVVDEAVPESLSKTGSRWHTPQGPLELSVEQMLSWGDCPAEPSGGGLRVAGGGLIAGRLLAWTDTQVVLANTLLGRVVVPMALVQGWQALPVRQPVVPKAVPFTLELTNGDLIRAAELRLPTDAASLRVTLSSEQKDAPPRQISLPKHRVRRIERGAAASPTGNGVAATGLAIVGLQDGSRFAVSRFESDEEQTLTLWPSWHTDDAPQPLTCLRDDLTGVLATDLHAVPLASLPVAAFEQTPRLGPGWPLTPGTTLLGGPLSARGQRAFTGFGLHAACRVAWELPECRGGDRRDLVATVAIDDSAGQGGSVVLRVRAGDGPAHSKEIFVSQILRGGAVALPLEVAVNDARWLELVVDPAGDGDVLDRTVWLEPRLLTRRTSQTDLRAPSPAASDASPETSLNRR